MLTPGSTNAVFFLPVSCYFVHLVKNLRLTSAQTETSFFGTVFCPGWTCTWTRDALDRPQRDKSDVLFFTLVLHSSGGLLVFFSSNNLSNYARQGFPVKSLWKRLINFARKSSVLHLDILFCSLGLAVPPANSKSDISLTDAAFFNLS